MDSLDVQKLKKARSQGQSETDEGPYYHKSWWEAYKGSAKGKFGGAIIGAAVGALIGIIAAPVLAIAGIATATASLTIVGLAAAGMVYGAHEFGDIGKTVGSDAALGEKLEKRLKSYVGGQFDELKQDVAELKAAVRGEPAPERVPAKAEKQLEDEQYTTTHCDDHCPPSKQLIYPKITLIGLAVGLVAGALLAASPIGAAVIGHELGMAGTAATMTVMGLFGASFGINRDLFRGVFDKTDLLFKGITKRSPSIEPQQAMNQAQEAAPQKAPEKESSIATAVFYADGEAQKSGTYHADKITAERKAILLGYNPGQTPAH
jgi:hypothetical protein